MRHFEEHIEMHSDPDRLPDLEYGLAQVLWWEGYDHEARVVALPAMDVVRERLRTDEDDLQAWSQLGGFQCDIFWQFDEAVEALEKAILIDPENLGAQWSLQVAYEKNG